jgi:hypothetical protein
LNVLITNLLVGGLSGTEQYTRVLAHALQKRGHLVAIYSPSEEDSAPAAPLAGLRVCRTLDAVSFQPDVLHCHHLPCAVDAVLRWPRTPSIFVVHDARAWHDALPPVEAFDVVAAVDQRCAERVAGEAPGVPVQIVPNPIDQERIVAARRARKPRSMLVYGKSARSTSWNRRLRLAALANGIWTFRTLHRDPDPLLQIGRYDIILARARCALEACLSGAHTILYDRGLCGEAVTPENVEHLLRWNFGASLLRESLTYRRFVDLIRSYSADDALEAARILRPLVDPDAIASSFESLYQRCRSIRSRRAPDEATLKEKLEFARRLSEAVTLRQERFPSSRGFFRAPATR